MHIDIEYELDLKSNNNNLYVKSRNCEIIFRKGTTSKFKVRSNKPLFARKDIEGASVNSVHLDGKFVSNWILL